MPLYLDIVNGGHQRSFGYIADRMEGVRDRKAAQQHALRCWTTHRPPVCLGAQMDGNIHHEAGSGHDTSSGGVAVRYMSPRSVFGRRAQ